MIGDATDAPMVDRNDMSGRIHKIVPSIGVIGIVPSIGVIGASILNRCTYDRVLVHV